MTMVVAWISKRNGKLGDAPPGHFDLGERSTR